MGDLILRQVSKKIAGCQILDNIDLVIPAGKFFALLGPSGCGKTTLLRLIAGLESVDSGRIFLGNEDITHEKVHKRPINIVFQNYALFPHLTVFENIAYSLTIQKLNKERIQHKVNKLLHAFHLEKHVHKKPHELSGGQQQRVAIARAIINEPKVLLLDEPLAALDSALRDKLLIELIDLQDKLQMTFIYITHDQDEALTVADEMAIMTVDGEFAQLGTPKEIYEFPSTPFVAQFVGSTNMFSGTLLEEDKFSVPQLGEFVVARQKEKSSILPGCSAYMCIRPEKIFIAKKMVQGFTNILTGVVESIVYTGRSTTYEVILENGQKIQVFEQNEEHFWAEDIDYDDEVFLFWQKENVVLLEHTGVATR